MVPSLVAFCLHALVPYPDQVALPVPLRIRPRDTILDELVPDPAVIDPNLWAVLIQVYDALPPSLTKCTLPLADSHVSLLQSLSPTPYFSLITLLSLSACPNLTDDSILLFKSLHTLVGFDASGTALTSYAIQTLAAILQHNGDADAIRAHRGPWELRILSLRNCKQITNDVYSHLQKFPLLSVVDLRGTQCTSQDSSFKPCPFTNFHHPTSLVSSLAALHAAQPNLTISPEPYILNINALQAPVPKNRPLRAPAVGPQDAFVVIPSNPTRPIRLGNIHVLERQTQEREDRERHEMNKEAWYARQERAEARQMEMDEPGEYSDSRPKRSGLKQSRELSDFIKSSSRHKNDAVAPRLSAANPKQFSTNAHIPSMSRTTRPRLSTSMLHPPTAARALNQGNSRIPASRIPSSLNSSRRTATENHASDRRSFYLNKNAPQSSSASISSRLPGRNQLVQRNTVTHAQRPPNTSSAAPPHRRPTALINTAAQGQVAPSTTARNPSVSAINFYQPNAARAPNTVAKDATRIVKDDDKGDSALRLYRHPPPYAHLRAIWDPSTSKHYQCEEIIEGLPAKASLKEMAVLDQTRADHARNAMKVALESRLSTSSASSSSVTPVFGGGFATSSQTRGTRDGSVLVKRHFGVPSFESSFESDQAPTPAATPTSRNPFRKRASFPRSSPSITGLITEPASTVSTAVQSPDTVSTAVKSINRSSSLSSMKSSLASASASGGLNALRPSMSMTTPTSAKPLIPISAVKVPLLPDDVRRADEGLSASARKKRKVQGDYENGDEEEDGQAASRRASVGVPSKTIPGVKVKTKEKPKVAGKQKNSFDWNSWSKQ